jgi:hypothetical protein
MKGKAVLSAEKGAQRLLELLNGPGGPRREPKPRRIRCWKEPERPAAPEVIADAIAPATSPEEVEPVVLVDMVDMVDIAAVEGGATNIPSSPKRPGPCKGQKLRKYAPLTAEQDEEIKRVYQVEQGMQHGSSGRAPVRELADKFGVPRWIVSNRAGALGVVPVSHVRKKEPNWTEAEYRILRENAARPEAVIQRRLRNAGYSRTIVSIRIKIQRSIGGKPKDGYSGTVLSGLIGFNKHTIFRWIESGLLIAERRGTKRTSAQGGDSWVIRKKDVRDFVVKNVELIDFRKVDKFWLVELLTGHGERNIPVNYFRASKWFGVWVMSNFRDLPMMGDCRFICKCCPHRTDSHMMNCLECCPITRAVELLKGGAWAVQHFNSHLRVKGFYG